VVKTSVIIATYRRPEPLARLIKSLAPQLVSGKHELLIAENGTPSPTPLAKYPFAIVHLHNPIAGKCRIQNEAIRQARGAIIVCLDDDLTVAADYLGEVERFFDTYPEYAAMKGRTVAAEDPVAKAGAAAVWLDLPIVDHGDEVIEVRGVLGANMAFRAAALAQVGPFDERLGPGAAGHEEETEMSARLRRAGLKIGYAPHATVYHEVDAARANRERFLRIARERGRARMIHERHGGMAIRAAVAIAALRTMVARIAGAGAERMAREEKRLAIARGMLDGLREGIGNR